MRVKLRVLDVATNTNVPGWGEQLQPLADKMAELDENKPGFATSPDFAGVITDARVALKKAFEGFWAKTSKPLAP